MSPTLETIGKLLYLARTRPGISGVSTDTLARYCERNAAHCSTLTGPQLDQLERAWLEQGCAAGLPDIHGQDLAAIARGLGVELWSLCTSLKYPAHRSVMLGALSLPGMLELLIAEAQTEGYPIAVLDQHGILVATLHP